MQERTCFTHDHLRELNNDRDDQNKGQRPEVGQIKRFKQMTDYHMKVDFPSPIPQVDRLTVRWTDRNGQLISFNGLEDNSFALKIHTRRVNACP